MPDPLWINADCALFLDFDGTLVDLAATPDAVIVEPGVKDVLSDLSVLLKGAVAIVSGRPIQDIDRMLAPLQLPVAGVHGAERRDAAGELRYASVVDLEPVERCIATLQIRFPLLKIEPKRGALAVHYRQIPEAGPAVLAELQTAVRRCPGASLLPGKMVVEIKASDIDKAGAIRDFLSEAPFHGRRPVFAGDDVTDEVGFAFVQQRNGVGIKVGEGATVALRRLPDPAAVREALRSAAHLLLIPPLDRSGNTWQ